MNKALKEALLNVFFPCSTCPLCQRLLVGWERIICCHCECELERCRLTPLEQVSRCEPLSLCLSAFAYEGVAKQLVHLLKYQRNATIAPILGLSMCSVLLNAPGIRRWDAVVPVPLHASRLYERGYNQSQLLAEAIADCMGIPLRLDLLWRIRASKSQTTRTAEERRQAMKNTFAASPKALGLHILLVDDVFTTGATASACATELIDAGAASVTLITACRA